MCPDMPRSMLTCFAKHFVLIMRQRANGSDGQGQNRRREGSDGDISSLSDGRWAVRALQTLHQPCFTAVAKKPA